MPEQVYSPKKYVDALSTFDNGMESGTSPVLLEKTQVAVGINCSLREGFIHPRPPVVQKTLTFGGNTATAALMGTGYFQGAGYYRPDFGTELLIAGIAGHILTFTETSTNGPWAVVDVSIPGNLNSATGLQTWMWQSEKWEIINDGSGILPIFFDGTTCRRSLGPSQVVGTGIAFDPGTPPPIGQVVQITLNAPYTGGVNLPVIFNGAFYEVIANPDGYAAILTNLTDTPGNTVPTGTPIIFNPALAAIVNGNSSFSWVEGGPQGPFDASAQVDSYIGVGVGDQISFMQGGTTYVFVVASLETISGEFFINGTPLGPDTGFSYVFEIALGTQLLFQGVTAPTVTVGITNANYVVPAVGSSVQVLLSQPYGGVANERVSINGAVYSITGVGTQAQSEIIYLINSADTSTSPYTNPSTIETVPELPAGRMGCYGMGRNWFSLTNGTNYEAGDIVGGGSGTAAYNYRDAVLRTTENDFLTNGGFFSLPGTGDIITAMVFPPVLDTSLGVGSLQIFTPFSVYANNAPADRTTWTNLTWPIQTESLKDQGALAQNSTVVINSDVFFRSDFNICSLVLARRQFQVNQWGNKPVADEMQRILELDNQTLLPYGSAVSFDNRFLMTTVPNVMSQGVFHSGLIALNFDPLSSLRTNLPPAWEGAWSGINVMQLVTGRVNGMRRNFAFSYNLNANQIELYELLSEQAALLAGQYNDVANGVSVPIVWMFETAALFNKDIHQLTELIQLRDGEIQISNIIGTVTIQIYYKPDYYPCWTLWRQVNVCANMSGTNANPTYHMRIGLGEPDGTVQNITRPMRIGRFFQFRFVITGYCEFNNLQASAITVPEPVFSPVNENQTTCQAIDCVVPPDLTLYSLQGLPPQVLPPVPPPVFAFKNTAVYFAVSCPGQTLNFTGSLPTWITLDQTNNQLIGAAGTFGGTSQLAANNTAQSALNAFGQQQVSLGNLVCGAYNCPANAPNMAITGYFDGLIPVNEGTSATDQPVWDGTFKFYNPNAGCYWFGWQQGDSINPLYAIHGFLCYCATLAYNTGTGVWTLQVYDSINEGQVSWSGTFTGNVTGVGTYTNDNTGVLPTPTTLNVEQISGTATNDINGPLCAVD